MLSIYFILPKNLSKEKYQINEVENHKQQCYCYL